MKKRALNISLRGVTLASRFLFIFFVAKYLNPSDLGLYGIFTATVGYALYFVGLDFYVYTTREILKNGRDKWGGYLKNQISLSSVLYVVLIITLAAAMMTDKISSEQALWFIGILILEHINQEISRLLVAINKQTAASALLFIRQGLWAIVLVAMMWLQWIPGNLSSIYTLWFTSGVISLIAGVVLLKKIKMGGWNTKINYAWIKDGIKVSGLFLIATLALRGLQTIDRYWVQYLNGLEVVGAYVLFIGMASTLMTFLDAGVFSFSYPTLINMYNQGDKKGFQQHLYKMSLTTIVITLIFIVVSLTLMPYLIAWTGKDIFNGYLEIYYILLVATVCNALGMIVHYALYAIGKDKVIIISHIGSLLVFAVTVYSLQNWNKVVAVPLGMVAAFLFIFVFKLAAYIKYRHSD